MEGVGPGKVRTMSKCMRLTTLWGFSERMSELECWQEARWTGERRWDSLGQGGFRYWGPGSSPILSTDRVAPVD